MREHNGEFYCVDEYSACTLFGNRPNPCENNGICHPDVENKSNKLYECECTVSGAHARYYEGIHCEYEPLRNFNKGTGNCPTVPQYSDSSVIIQMVEIELETEYHYKDCTDCDVRIIYDGSSDNRVCACPDGFSFDKPTLTCRAHTNPNSPDYHCASRGFMHMYDHTSLMSDDIGVTGSGSCKCIDGKIHDDVNHICEEPKEDICERYPVLKRRRPCENGGICTYNADSYEKIKCICPTIPGKNYRFQGDRCELSPGTCTVDRGCVCPKVPGSDQRFTGDQCEIRPTCAINQCANGGTCATDQNGKEFCNCPEYFEGDFCQIRPPCENNPCQNGGNCIHYVGEIGTSFYCDCQKGYVGNLCQDEISTVTVTGSGDVHYETLDHQWFDNQGWCSYTYATNTGVCKTSSMQDLTPNDAGYWEGNNLDYDSFTVAVTHRNLEWDDDYEYPVSILDGLTVFVKVRKTGALFRFSISYDVRSWSMHMFTGNNGEWADESKWREMTSAHRYTSNANLVAQNVAIRSRGSMKSIYLGVCQVTGCDPRRILQKTNTPRDFIFAFHYDPEFRYITATASGVLANNICGIVGNFNGIQDDFGEYSDWDARLAAERDLEIEHHNLAVSTCQFTANGIPVPNENTVLSNSRKRKKRMTEGQCNGNFNAITAACQQLNNSPFSGCSLSRSEMIVNCIFDSCTAPTMHEEFVCNMIAEYVVQCNDAVGETQISSWRTNSLCPLTCGANEHFESCTNSNCWPTTEVCTVDSDLCNNSVSDCAEGCFCDSGFLRDGESCVADTEENCQEAEAEEVEEEIAQANPCASDPCLNGGSCANLAGNIDYRNFLNFLKYILLNLMMKFLNFLFMFVPVSMDIVVITAKMLRKSSLTNHGIFFENLQKKYLSSF